MRSRFAFPLLAYAFAAIMVGTTPPTPMYVLYGERMHFAVLTTTVIFAGIGNHAAAGAIACLIFAASAVAQLGAGGIAPPRAVALGCAILVVGMVILAGALHLSSLPGLIAAAVVAGVGQGISFSRGLAAVAERTPPERRAEVSSTYFVVAYVAISLPVLGEGLAARAWGLRTAGVGFAVAVAILAVICLAAILVQEARDSRKLTAAAPRL